MCTVLLPGGVNPTAINKYNNIYKKRTLVANVNEIYQIYALIGYQQLRKILKFKKKFGHV
jgi:hypothetical protein